MRNRHLPVKIVDLYRVKYRHLQAFFLFLIISLSSLPVSATHHEPAMHTAPNGWQYFSTTLDDGRSVHQIQKTSAMPVVDKTGKKYTLILAIECRGKESTAAFALKEAPLTIKTSMSRISLQINEGKIKKQRFHRAANQRAVLIRNSREAINFVQSLFGKNILRVTAPFTAPKISSVEFNIGDIQKAAAPISAACAWPEYNQ